MFASVSAKLRDAWMYPAGVKVVEPAYSEPDHLTVQITTHEGTLSISDLKVDSLHALMHGIATIIHKYEKEEPEGIE